jgi:hypothetical protein
MIARQRCDEVGLTVKIIDDNMGVEDYKQYFKVAFDTIFDFEVDSTTTKKQQGRR